MRSSSTIVTYTRAKQSETLVCLKAVADDLVA
jgi:hypothetical protein